MIYWLFDGCRRKRRVNNPLLLITTNHQSLQSVWASLQHYYTDKLFVLGKAAVSSSFPLKRQSSIPEQALLLSGESIISWISQNIGFPGKGSCFSLFRHRTWTRLIHEILLTYVNGNDKKVTNDRSIDFTYSFCLLNLGTVKLDF